MLLIALPAVCPALLIPEPADDVTFERPWEALDADSLAFDDVVLAASDVVDAWRSVMRPT